MATRSTPPPDQREHPSAYDDVTLMRILVEDAVMSHATELRWFTAAIATLARRTRKPAEQVFIDLCDEVEAITGHRHLPMHSGKIL